MSKDNIIKFLKFTEIAMLICVSLICIVLAILSDSDAIRYILAGLGIGAIIGGIIDIKIVMPRKLKDKDERTMIMLLMAQLTAYSIGYILMFLSFTFVVYDVVEFTSYGSYVLFSLILVILFVIIEKVAYKIIDSRM